LNASPFCPPTALRHAGEAGQMMPVIANEFSNGCHCKPMPDPTWRITTSPAMFPPKRYPMLMYLGSRFENGRLCAKTNGPNLNSCSHEYRGGGSRRGGYSPGIPPGAEYSVVDGKAMKAGSHPMLHLACFVTSFLLPGPTVFMIHSLWEPGKVPKD